jgi:hypothetical protein
MLHSFYKEQGRLIISYYKSNKANYYYEKKPKQEQLGKHVSQKKTPSLLRIPKPIWKSKQKAGATTFT